MFVPQLMRSLKGYTRRQLTADVTAGVVVGIVALPLAMAFAIASGLPPERGLFTAIVAGFLISALGGSRVQIGGPTGAFVVIVFDIVHRYGVSGLTVCTIMAGFILIALGAARLGGSIKYIPYPVITGFTSGIALIICTSQVKDLLGLTTGPLPGKCLGQWQEYVRCLGTVNWAAAGIGALCIGLIAFWPKAWRRVPGTVVAMLLATVLVQLFGLPVETIGSRFGRIPGTLPAVSVPAIGADQIRELIFPAITIALLAGIESLLSAVVADGMTGYRHDSNVELLAQGVANVVSPLFGGFCATGAIARTATNIRNGGATPIAGMVHALTLFAILLVFGRWASLVPMCCLAAVLVVVSYNMSEWRTFRALLRAPRSDVLVLLTTFLVTVVFDLTIAVLLGVVLAAFLFMKRMADATRVGPSDGLRIDPDAAAAGRPLPAGVRVYEGNGPFFFGSAEKLRDVLAGVPEAPPVLILRMGQVPLIDATGLHMLEHLHEHCTEAGRTLVLSAVREQPLAALRRSGLLKAIGKDNLTQTFAAALDRAQAILGPHRDESQGRRAA